MSHEIVALMILVILSQISSASHSIKTFVKKDEIDFYAQRLKKAKESTVAPGISLFAILISIVLRAFIACYALQVIFSLIN